MQSLFDAVRKACGAASWSRGVELVRADAVLGESAGADEIVVRITMREGMISRTVRLFLDDDGWECTCGAAGCEHAAAAVIALKRAREEGKELPAPRFAVGKVAYRFARLPAGLALERGIVAQDRFHPLDTTLANLAARRVDGPGFSASQADLAVELALGTHRRGLLPRPLVDKTLAAMIRCEDVTLDGKPVRTAIAPVLPRITVSDQADGFRVVLEPDPSLTEVFANGIALCGDLLRPLAEPPLTARELQDFSRGTHFGRERAAELVTEVLPSLRGRLPVEVRATRLPELSDDPPRVALAVTREGSVLSVLATLVYGDPPRGRVDGGRLVHLGGPVPMRDEPAERRLLRRLSGELGLAPGLRATFAGAEAVAFNQRLDRWSSSIRGAGRDWFRLLPSLVPRIRVQADDLDVSFEPAPGGAASSGRGHGLRADPREVMRAWRAGESLVPLLGGGWAPLPTEWLARFGHRVADLLAAKESAGRLPVSAMPDLARLCDDLDMPRPPGFERLAALLGGFEGIPEAPLPSDLRATLRPYQRDGVAWLRFLREAGLGALLADDMGLGKTLQTLCAVRGRTLVVAPTSVLHNWREEIERFRPALRCALYHGPRRALDPEVDVTVTSYALLRIDADRLAAVAWDTVVLDEAQTIKNPESQVATAAYRLRGEFRVALSGTPVENRLDELWSQIHFVNPGLLGGRRDFDERYARPIADGVPGAAERLRERIRPFVLRRLKRVVAPELPPRTDTVLRCELDPIARQVYDAVHAATKEEVVRKLMEGGGNVLAALEALLRLRQAACHPALVPGQTAEGSAKVTLLVETLDTILAEEGKALVFSQWTSLLDLIEPHLRAAAIDFIRLDGSTVDRAGVVARFQDPAGPPVLLVSLKAGGSGLNLTAADHVFLMDPWWNPAVEDQAADRAHRIGQDRPVFVHRLVAEETVEERILALQDHKRTIAEAALGSADAAASITREELLALLA